jgi:hypothetical protein
VGEREAREGRPSENVQRTVLPNLLPNSVARGETERDEERFAISKFQTIRHVSGHRDTRRDGRDEFQDRCLKTGRILKGQALYAPYSHEDREEYGP